MQTLTCCSPPLPIEQYFALALHDTVNGQLFLSILNSEYEVGGLGLSPSHFSTLIAIMCLFQICYQFYIYPKLGPPLGRLNHIQMFRLGSFLYIPAYLTTPLLRAFASAGDDGSPFLMFALTVNMAFRYAGGTFCYTSIMILTNAMRCVFAISSSVHFRAAISLTCCPRSAFQSS